MQLNSEVLPAPLGPTRPKICPGSTMNDTSCSTLMPPNRRLTSCSVSRAGMPAFRLVASPDGHASGLGGPRVLVKGTVRMRAQIVNDFGAITGRVYPNRDPAQ